jgi:hypothetical protein
VLLLLNNLRIAIGEIVDRTENVHGHPLIEEEQKVKITQVTAGPCTHPVYKYSLEEGGYCSWKTADIRLKE